MGLKYRIEDSVFIPYLTLMLKYRIEDSVFIQIHTVFAFGFSHRSWISDGFPHE